MKCYRTLFSLLFSVIILTGHLAWADTATTVALNTTNTPTLPCQATDFVAVGNQLQLNQLHKSGQLYFLLRNMTNYKILLNRQQSTLGSVGASAGWSSQLSPGQASILALNEPDFKLSCVAYNPPQFGGVNCQSVLNVCAYPVQKQIIGSYWIAENIDPNTASVAFQKRNVQLTA